MIIVRMEQLTEMVGLSPSSIWRRVASGELPQPISLGARARGWPLEEITAWLEAKRGERDARRAKSTKEMTR